MSNSALHRNAGDSGDIASKTSIIVPTHTRPHADVQRRFLRRLLGYYRRVACPFSIVVADSGDEAGRAEREGIIDSAGIARVLHLALDPKLTLEQKLPIAIEQVDTEYIAICADDDFLVPETISKCVTFLEDNPDYAIAHGHAVSVRLGPAEEDGLRIPVSTHPYGQCNLESGDPIERLSDHLSHYTATFYSVHRRIPHLRNLKLTLQRTEEARFGELLPSCLSVVQGKAKRMESLYLVREADPMSLGHTLPTMHDLMSSDRFRQLSGQFVSCLAEEIAAVCGIPLENATSVAERCFRAYVDALEMRRKTQLAGRRRPALWRRAARRALSGIGLLELVRARFEREQSRADGPRDPFDMDQMLTPDSPHHRSFLPIHSAMTLRDSRRADPHQ